MLYDGFDRLGRPVPRRLQNIAVANARARLTYVTQVSSCRLTLFRAKTGDDDDAFSVAWARLAAGGVDVHAIASPGIRHDNIMKEPYVEALAAEMNRCMEQALGGIEDDGSTCLATAEGAAAL
jgi:thioesterase domain-containing protein